MPTPPSAPSKLYKYKKMVSLLTTIDKRTQAYSVEMDLYYYNNNDPLYIGLIKANYPMFFFMRLKSQVGVTGTQTSTSEQTSSETLPTYHKNSQCNLN